MSVFCRSAVALAAATILTAASVVPCRAAEGFSTDDWLLAPVRVHLLSASNAPAFHTTLKDSDIDRILKKINRVWSQAGISFWLESLVREEAINTASATNAGASDNLHGLLALRPERTRDTNMFHLYYVKKLSVNGVYLGEAMFVKDTASLREVPGGIDEPIPRVSSHEIGHALTLQHCANEQHLLFRGTTGTNLDEVEITQARKAAKKLPWIQSAAAVASSAAEARRSGKGDDARLLSLRLAAMPLDIPTNQTPRQATESGRSSPDRAGSRR